MMATSDQMILWAVIVSRFLLPLAIPRYPLPAVVACMLLDAADYQIFNWFTSLPIESLEIYQGYDKSLDIYYLSIAYISTLRNWTNPFAFKLDRFLFFYRLAGVALFELTQIRAILLIFPNTFEYFFIAYEAFRMRQDPLKLTRRKLIIIAAFIWIYIKLPQESWIHIIQPNYPNLVKDNPWTILIAAAWFLGIAAFAWWLLREKQPERKVSLAADPIPADFVLRARKRDMIERSGRFFDASLLEKIALVSLLSVIFAQILTGIQSSNIQIAVGVAVLIVINSALSQWLSRRGIGWRSILQEFMVMTAVNFGLIITAHFLLPRYNGSIDLGNTLFFALLLTLIVTIYDWYRQVYLYRFSG
ncbi:MAG: hypothetical protein HPY61_10410 [Methanotrichaceae archaeon]|nr:hypothetical protein [Methanotrichaceae archaeon]